MNRKTQKAIRDYWENCPVDGNYFVVDTTQETLDPRWLIPLDKETAEDLARIANSAGLEHIYCVVSFDGLEQ